MPSKNSPCGICQSMLRNTMHYALHKLFRMQLYITADIVMRTPKQSGVRQISKVCKEYAGLCAVNMRSQNSVTNNRNNAPELLLYMLTKRVTFDLLLQSLVTSWILQMQF